MKHWKPSCKSHMWDQDKSDGYNGWLDSDSNLSIYWDNKIEVQTHYLEYKNLNSKPRLEDLSNIESIIGCRWGWPTCGKNWGEKHSPHSGNDMCTTNVQWSKCNATTTTGNPPKWKSHSMEITVYQPSILVDYCDLMTSISTVSHGFLFCWIFWNVQGEQWFNYA